MDDLDFLAQVSLFSRLSKIELRNLAKLARRRIFPQGTVIAKEGDPGRELFIVARGTVNIFTGYGQSNQRYFTTFGPLDHFGEMALIDDLVRSATAVANEEAELLVLDQLNLRDVIERKPFIALDLLKTLSHRVRALQKLLANSLGGLLPICLNCKNIRDESGNWVPIEDYISDHTDADFSHGICPNCLKTLYPRHFKQE